ncbi:MAG: hypothetical protein ACYC5G_04050 [Candidatus Doudnabacteria bacterium]
MARGLVEKVTWFSQWEYQGKVNHNFVVKFKEDDENRFIYVGNDKDNPKFKVGETVEYKLDGRKIKGNIGQTQFEYEKISLVQAQGAGFGGNGGGKSFTKSPEIFRNEMVSYCSSYAKDCIIHRVNLGKDAKEIIAIYEELVDGFVKASNKHIK